MSRDYKNILKKEQGAYGNERRQNLAKEILKDSTPLPKPVEYKDIDEEFKRWVEDDLSISFEGERIPTIALFSNQRFGEYMQSWQNVDEQKNIILNFKLITRETNPKSGTINGNTKNIPGNHTMLLKRVEARDKNDRKYYIDYRVKQPIGVDLTYTLGIVTNKYELINEFNLMLNEKFKSIDCYIRPKGHFMAMKLNDISDETEYSIDNRRFYSQTFNIVVMGYVMPEDSFIVEERPEIKFIGFEGDDRKTNYADIEELPCDFFMESPYAYKPIHLTIHFGVCSSSYKFVIDSNFQAKEVELTNVRGFKIYVNDEETILDENFRVKENDEIKIKSLTRPKTVEESEIKIIGFDPTDTYKKDDGEIITEIDLS